MTNLGLLILRLGIGVIFIFHGFPKLAGGMAKWSELGGAMSFLGISFYPAFWGFMAAVSEFFGALCLILGIFFKPSCVLLVMTMAVATVFHLGRGDGFTVTSHALAMFFVFLSLFFIGPGRFRVYDKV